MDDLISRQELCEYALNQKDKSVTPNDIMRFSSAPPETHDKRTETHACDLISRQQAIDATQNATFSFTIKSDIDFANYRKEIQEIFNNVLDAQEKALNELPSAQPTQTNADSTQTNALDCVSRRAAMIVIENSGLDDDSLLLYGIQ